PRTVEICKGPAHGTVCVDPCTGEVTYTADCNYSGKDKFTYKVQDCNGNWSNVASVCVTVTSPRQTAELCNSSVSVAKNKCTTIKPEVRGATSDCAPDWCTLCVVDQPCHGTIKVDAKTGKITYTPDKNYCGCDTFTYQVKDKQGRCLNVAT